MWLKKLDPCKVLHTVPPLAPLCDRNSWPLLLVARAPSLPAADLALSAIRSLAVLPEGSRTEALVACVAASGASDEALLVHGYHLTSECGSLTGKQQMPTWMRDESKAWQAQVEQLISEKLVAKDSQIWQDAVIVGRVTDENTVAYQCMWLGNKVGALETIISAEYDPSLKHRDYNGPTYWFEPVNGKVDISDAFKAGKQQANVAIGDTSGVEKQSKPSN